MKLTELVNKGKFIITAEVGPPKGTDIKIMLEDAELLRNKVDFINITDQQSSVMRLGSLTTCYLLKSRGIEPIYQVTCRDRNRIALQSDLLSAYVLGIENVLCLTGDHTQLGDHPDAKPVFDLDSVSLLHAAKRLTEGYDLSDKELQGKPDFCLGAVVTPIFEPIELQIIKMEKKIKAGAEFFQTQAVYEPDKFAKFIDKVKHFNVPIIVGIVLLKSAGMARFMNKNVAGVHVPDEIIKELEDATNKVEKSIEITTRLINELKPLCQGIHLMPIGWEKKIPKILEKAGLINS